MKADPYAQGAEAYIAGHDESKNPYDLKDNESAHLDWNDGWNDAAEADNED